MEITIITATPNKNGHTLQIIEYFKNYLPAKYTMFNAYDMQFKACVDCKLCFKHAGCAIKDEVQDVFSSLINADLVIVASPMYFGTLAGPLLSLLSRLQFYFANVYKLKLKPIFKKKKGILVMTAGQKWYNMFAPAEAVMTLVFEHMNAIKIASIYSTQTDKIPTIEQPEVEEQVKTLCHLLKN